MDRVLAIVVTFNAIRWIDRCLESLRTSIIKTDIYVIDNGSTDGTQSYISDFYPEAFFVQNCKNVGFGQANNIGLSYALEHHYNYVYLMNQDAWIYPNTISELINISRKYPQYGILSPFQIQANEKTLDENYIKNVCSWFSNPRLLSDLYFASVMPIYDVNNVMAAHWLITIDCLKRVGGFSPTFPHYGEDDDYVQRTLYHHLNVGIVPSVRGVHDRENRPVPDKKKGMYMNYIRSLCFLSLLNKPIGIRTLIKSAISDTRHYRSLRPLRYLFKILYDYQTIKKNREKALVGRAFI